MKNIKIIEVPSEIGAGTRGASLGVEAIKIAALDFMSNFFIHFPSEKIPTENKLLHEPIESPYAKRIKGMLTMYDRISKAVSETMKNNFFPVVISGDQGIDNKECAVHKPDSLTLEYWNKLKHIGKICPKVSPDDIVFISLRDFEKEEKNLLDRLGIKKISAKEIRSKGAENIVRSILRYLSDCTDIYLSFDVDCLDASISKGTGTPVGNGLREREAEDLVSKFMQNRKICCFEITEVNPTLDKENLMAEIAFNILQRSVNILMMN